MLLQSYVTDNLYQMNEKVAIAAYWILGMNEWKYESVLLVAE